MRLGIKSNTIRDYTLVPPNCPTILGSNNQSHSRSFPIFPDPIITIYPGVGIYKQPSNPIIHNFNQTLENP